VKKPLLSVCVITYNQAPYVRQALDSVLAQKVDFDWEIVIADDYSTDGTREIILEYQKEHPDLIKVIFQKKNVGAERNWLDLINHPTSKYIAYLEGDDFWDDPSKLQLQVDFLEKNSDYAFCFHLTRVFFEKGEEQQAIWPKLNSKFEPTTAELLKENFVPSNSAVYRRQNYTNYPVGVMPGDWYLHLYHAQFGKIGFINRVMSAYRRHSGGAWWDSYRDQDAFWEKNGLSVLAFHSEIMKIYGKNDDYKQIISKATADTLDKLVRVDLKSNRQLVKKAVRDFSDIVENGIAYQQHRHEELSHMVQKKDEEIEDLTVEVLDLRSTSFQLRDELHALRNSRVLGKIIKTRDKIGSPYTLPKRAINKTRRTVAKFVPDSIRLPLMKSLRRVRDGAKQNMTHRPAVIVPVKNVAWSADIPLVSIVIPYYNRADTIDETLASLASQTFINFETIIVDDGSTDQESVEKLKELKTGSPVKVKLVHQPNSGVASARNKGIELAKGKYIICLDSDDMLESTFIEKATVALEANPDVSLVSTYQDMFGVVNEVFEKHSYDPMRLIDDNMVITAAQFRREAWKQSGGYKSEIGYEDWEFWLTLAENGYWGKQIPEPLFKYRTSMQSRYVDDKDVHWNNLKTIRAIHSDYKKRIRSLVTSRSSERHVATSQTAFMNMKRSKDYRVVSNGNPNVLVTVPWMDFGGVSTLLNNFTREVASDVNLHFITGLPNKNEWEYKFKNITSRVYHMPNLFDEDAALQYEFMANYIKTRNIDILHIVHNGFVYPMLSELKKLFPELRVVTTVFNDRAPYLRQSVDEQQSINTFTTDNLAVAGIYQKALNDMSDVRVIPNGIDSADIFNPALFDINAVRESLKIAPKDVAVFYIGRLSEEKNPDLFVEMAGMILKKGLKNARFFIVGDGPMRSQIEYAIHDLKTDRVTYLGYQSDIAKYLSAADVFVLPSSVEGFPLSIIEAMAMNVAVVATNVGAVSDVIADGVNGIVVSEVSALALANSLERVLETPSELSDIQSKTRREVEKKYSNTILGKNYRKLYKDLSK
jgi:glycosyltransferase involved in cell wall biosynthesis